ncbi:uncharacterized protein LOC116253871 [Nymphaea colorata]|nr:uncharacterized protein LOC116253871 [Nymphaea colorata]
MQGVASFFRRSATEIGGNLRLSFANLVRSYSAEASASSSAASASQQATKKRKRRKKKNLFEVAQFLPNWGLGYHLAKGHWDGVYYKITKINLYKDGRHGKAWGVFYKDGLPTMDAPKKISGVHKRCWRYIPDSSRRASDIGLKSELQPEVQA